MRHEHQTGQKEQDDELLSPEKQKEEEKFYN